MRNRGPTDTPPGRTETQESLEVPQRDSYRVPGDDLETESQLDRLVQFICPDTNPINSDQDNER